MIKQRKDDWYSNVEKLFNTQEPTSWDKNSFTPNQVNDAERVRWWTNFDLEKVNQIRTIKNQES